MYKFFFMFMILMVWTLNSMSMFGPVSSLVKTSQICKAVTKSTISDARLLGSQLQHDEKIKKIAEQSKYDNDRQVGIKIQQEMAAIKEQIFKEARAAKKK